MELALKNNKFNHKNVCFILEIYNLYLKIDV